MAEYTNNTKALSGKRNADGKLVWVKPGETVDLGAVKAKPKKDYLVGENGPEIVAPEPEPDNADAFDDMSDADLREYIEQETGEKPHWKAKRETLLEQARSL